MLVTYTPEGGDRQQWTFDPDRVRVVEGEMIEKRFGDTWDKFRVAVMQGNLKARRVLLWHLMRRDHHTLRFEDTPDFYVGELKVEQSYAELIALRDKVQKANLSEEVREQVMTALDIEITEAMTAEGITDPEDAEGKAASNSSA